MQLEMSRLQLRLGAPRVTTTLLKDTLPATFRRKGSSNIAAERRRRPRRILTAAALGTRGPRPCID
eukprot:COSAG02_NODE_7719_length_2876_cov_2.813108_4_plen_66_part_00